MRELITSIFASAVPAVAFWWRWASNNKRWTPERFAVLSVTLFATLWNAYIAWQKWWEYVAARY